MILIRTNPLSHRLQSGMIYALGERRDTQFHLGSRLDSARSLAMCSRMLEVSNPGGTCPNRLTSDDSRTSRGAALVWSRSFLLLAKRAP